MELACTQLGDMWQAPVLGVLGGHGGVGASMHAAVLAARAERASVLVDLDAVAGGIDVLLGIEAVPGVRWSGLRLAGGDLDPSRLQEGLPAWGQVRVLAADTLPTPDHVIQLVSVARRVGPVVLDLGRWPTAARASAAQTCDLVVLLCRADVSSVAASRVALTLLTESSAPPAAAVVVRRDHGDPAAGRVAELVGAPLLADMPAQDDWDRREPLDPRRLPKRCARLAKNLWHAVHEVREASQ